MEQLENAFVQRVFLRIKSAFKKLNKLAFILGRFVKDQQKVEKCGFFLLEEKIK